MEKKEEAAAQFINALIKSVQTLCHGYLEFQNGIEIIGHINLSVDKGGSLDYILKEKVCRNAENSTLFISNSFYAESKAEEITQRRYSPLDSNAGPDVAMAQREGSKLASAISSISSSLSREKHKRGSDGRESHSSHKGSKRRSSQDHSEGHPAKVTHMLPESMHSGRGSSPVRSRGSLQGLGSPDGAASETLLPQTASVGDGSGIGVNLAGSVLEPVGNQNESDLARRDDDSDGDLEVTFIKEEYGQGDSSAGDFDSSGGHQFGGGSSLRDGSRFPVGLHDSSAGFMPGSFDQGAQYSPSDIASTSQPGPSGIRERFWRPPTSSQTRSTHHTTTTTRHQPPSHSPHLPQWSRNTFHEHVPNSATAEPEDVKPPIEDPQTMGDPYEQGYLPSDVAHYGDAVPPTLQGGPAEYQDHYLYSSTSSSTSTISRQRQSRTCPICGKWFDRWEYFQDHVNMHNKVKAHKCDNCASAFTYKRNLWQHVRHGVCFRQKQ
ncbi:uncharacterized protein LOC143293559 isoform X2 [Babylonia areolata]|uniref:uncharacterized protein LOC143293559 isoform X2 n=1 Tax=Babylonia areolata TaxID=304850 RepID=UPI003FD248DF